MRRIRGDVAAIAAIASGAAISFGLSATLFLSRPTPQQTVRVEVRRQEARPAREGITMLIPDGYRAISVKVEDEIATAGWVRPGSNVDVMVSLEDPTEAPSAKIVLQNAQVLGNDRSITRSPDGETMAIAIVTLLVTPDQAQEVAAATASGSLHLLLRNSNLERGTRRAEKPALYVKAKAPAPERP